MRKISEEIAHILLHVDAETAEPDPSQAPGMAARANKIRRLLKSFETDQRVTSRDQLVGFLKQAAATDPELLAALTEFRLGEEGAGQKLRLGLSEWVGKGRVRG